jgi:hypothetical protein
MELDKDTKGIMEEKENQWIQMRKKSLPVEFHWVFQGFY